MNVQTIRTEALSSRERAEILALCQAAYDEALGDYLVAAGLGVHLLGRVEEQLVAHVMLVERALQPAGLPPLRTGYVELVATHPFMQRRGYASTLLRALPPLMHEYDIGALSPSDAVFYARLGWELWTGPLSVRTSEGLAPTPDERVMVLRLPSTPVALDLANALSIEWRPGEVW